jgi:biotin synthase
MFPNALIPSTTALNSIDPNGRIMGIMAGANVVMPNLSPTEVRGNYALYDGKAGTNAEAAEGITQLEAQLATIGYHIDWGRGDHYLSVK